MRAWPSKPLSPNSDTTEIQRGNRAVRHRELPCRRGHGFQGRVSPMGDPLRIGSRFPLPALAIQQVRRFPSMSTDVQPMDSGKSEPPMLLPLLQSSLPASTGASLAGLIVPVIVLDYRRATLAPSPRAKISKLPPGYVEFSSK